MNILYRCFAVLLLVCALTTGSAAFAASRVPSDLSASLKKTPPAHPRLFLTDTQKPALREKIENEPLWKSVYDYLLANTEIVKELPPLTRKKTGKRLLSVSRACIQRVSYLALTYRMTGDASSLERAKEEMLAVAQFEDWNPSHFLDVAEMTMAMAIGYDWLYNDLDADTRATIRNAIVEKGLRTSLKGGGWVTTTHNWNQVCHGGLVAGALAVLEDEPVLSRRIIERALANVPRAMHEYEPDGVYPEGPSYWGYGTTYNVLLIAALESALGKDFGLSQSPGFMKTPYFYLQTTAPTGLYYNFSDCGTRGCAAAAMHWFGGRLQQPGLLWNEKKALEGFVDAKPNPSGSADRMLTFLLIWGQPVDQLETPKMLSWQGNGRTPIAILRNGWDANDAFFAIKGGSPGSNHAHMDIGSFVLDMEGVRWAHELGAQNYHNLESKGIDLWNRSQDSERWTVFRLNNYSHSTLTVDEQLQRVKGRAPITDFSSTADASFAIVDMTPVYEGQLRTAKRGGRLSGKTVLLQDELETLDRATSVCWGMMTQAAVEISADHPNMAVLKKDGKELTLKVLTPSDAVLSLYDAETPPQPYDEKNPDTRMLRFTTQIPASTQQTLTVMMYTGSAPENSPELSPLKKW